MRPSMSRMASVAGVLIAVVVLHPAGGEAGLLDCLWGGGAGGAAQTTYTPRYVAPSVYYPASSTAPAGPFARLRAALRSTPSSTPVAAGSTCYYVPQVAYRQVVQPTAVTSYVPIVTRDACTGCPVTAYQPVVTYSNQVRLVPYTTYRLVCTKAQYAPVVYATPTACSVQPTAYIAAPVATSSGCTTCVPTTTYYSAPATSTSPGSAGVSYPAVQPGQSTLPAGSVGVPPGSGGYTSYGGPSSGSGGSSGSGAGTVYGDARGAANGSNQPAGATAPAASGFGTGYDPSNSGGGGASNSGVGGTSSGTPWGGTSGGNSFRSGTGWPVRPGAVPLPSSPQRPWGSPVPETPHRSAPIENLQPPTAPAGPALSDPGDKTALLPPLVARSGEPVRGRLVPVERLHIPGDNNSTVENQTVGGAWSIVRN